MAKSKMAKSKIAQKHFHDEDEDAARRWFETARWPNALSARIAVAPSTTRPRRLPVIGAPPPIAVRILLSRPRP